LKALVYHGQGKKSWDEVPDPTLLEQTDAIVQVDTTTICGTDLHILKGDMPAVTEGRILGHEGVGTVLSVGSSVRTVKVGDRVIISCVSSCGVCTYCRSGNPSHCLADEGTSGLGRDPRLPGGSWDGRASRRAMGHDGASRSVHYVRC